MSQAVINLQTAKTKFDKIQDQLDNLSIFEQLSIANDIKLFVANDNSISQECDVNAEFSQERGEFLDTLTAFQRGIIQNVTIEEIKSKPSEEYDFEYSTAKEGLISLITNNISTNRQWEEMEESSSALISNFDNIQVSLSDILGKLREDKYKILLMSKYQTGKTTTLKAFCGGMDLAVIGKGNATTAIPTEVTYAEEDAISVEWNTKEDMNLILRMKSYIPELFDIDLDNPKECEQWLQNIEEMRKDSAYLDNNSQEASKYYALCAFILRYWNSQELQDLRTRKFTKEEILKYSAFPQFKKNLGSEHWIGKWEKSGMECFDIEKCAFVFIKHISIFSSSELMKQINSIIIDCPGLFSSNYDTKITEKLMQDTDAILCILPRDISLGGDQDEVYNALMRLKETYSDYKSKLVVANNLSYIDPNSENIESTNKETIKRLFAGQVPFIAYDAHLAYLEEIKKSYEQKLLDEESIQSFIDSHPKYNLRTRTTIHARDFMEAWENAFSSYRNFGFEGTGTESDFEKLNHQIRKFIESHKSFAIIVAGGIEKIENILKDVQTLLSTTYKEPYLLGYAKLCEEWNRRIESANQFEAYANEEINNTLNEDLCIKLTDATYEKLFPKEVYTSICEDIASDVFSNIKIIASLTGVDKLNSKLGKSHLGKVIKDVIPSREIKGKLESAGDELRDFMSKLVNSSITSKTNDRFELWSKLLISNQDSDFNNILIPSIHNFEDKLRMEWKYTFFSSDTSLKDSMSQYYDIPDSSNAILCRLLYKDKGGYSVGLIHMAEWLIGIIESIGAIVTGIVGGVVSVILASGPFALLLGVACVVGGAIWGAKLREKAKKDFLEGIVPEIKEALRKSELPSQLKEAIRGEVEKIFIDYKSNLKVDIDKLYRERDAALAVASNSDNVMDCFKAVEAMQIIGSQIKRYEEFKNTLLKKEDAV